MLMLMMLLSMDMTTSLTHTQARGGGGGTGQLLVGMKLQSSQEELFITLNNQVKDEVTLDLVPRDNWMNGRFPTDFILVQPRDPQENLTRIALIIQTAASVRFVVEEREISSRHVLSEPDVDKPIAHSFSKLPSRGGVGQRTDMQKSLPLSVAEELQAAELWAKNFTGRGVKVAVFDTGIHEGHPHFKNVRERLGESLSD